MKSTTGVSEYSLQRSRAWSTSATVCPRCSCSSTASLPDCAPKWSFVFEQYRFTSASDSVADKFRPDFTREMYQKRSGACRLLSRVLQSSPSGDECHQNHRQMHWGRRTVPARTGLRTGQSHQSSGAACSDRRSGVSGSTRRRTGSPGRSRHTLSSRKMPGRHQAGRWYLPVDTIRRSSHREFSRPRHPGYLARSRGRVNSPSPTIT